MIVLCFIAGIITGLVLAHRNHRRVALVGRFTVPSALVHGEQADPSRLTTFSTVDSLTGICLWVVCLQERSKPVCRLLSPDDAFDAPVGYEPDDGD